MLSPRYAPDRHAVTDVGNIVNGQFVPYPLRQNSGCAVVNWSHQRDRVWSDACQAFVDDTIYSAESPAVRKMLVNRYAVVLPR